MINQYIENSQYKEALELLENMDDEQTRYYRLVCLYGLEEYHQAKKEALKAKMLAEDTYYDVVAMQLSILKELEEFEDAINIVVEELSMPYIPYQYETTYNAAYDDLLLAKQEMNQDNVSSNIIFSEEDIESILQKEQSNEDLLYLAIEQMQKLNIRRLVPSIRMFLQNPNTPPFAKSLLIELMVEQDIDEDFVMIKEGVEYDVNPSYAPMVLQQEHVYTVLELLSSHVEDENPSLFMMCEQFANYYFYSVYPKYIDETDAQVIAGAIHYYLALLQYLEVELEDIEVAYQVDSQEVLEKMETFKSIEF